MKIDVLTLFPEMFESVFGVSIIKRALDNNLLSLRFVNIRDFSALSSCYHEQVVT